MLNEEPDDLSQAGRDEVRRVAEEDGALGVGASVKIELLGLRLQVDRVVGETPSALRENRTKLAGRRRSRMGLWRGRRRVPSC